MFAPVRSQTASFAAKYTQVMVNIDVVTRYGYRFSSEGRPLYPVSWTHLARIDDFSAKKDDFRILYPNDPSASQKL